MKENIELKTLVKKLREIFNNVYEELKYKAITNLTLDKEILNILKNLKILDKSLEIRFSEPIDSIYKAESGRTPYDLLSFGKVYSKKFTIFINNKFGDLYSNTRNDITTYNNLIRLYLGIYKQRLTSKITIDRNLIYKRISGQEIISYAVFVLDNKKRGAKFFLLEEIKDSFYINPRNNMLQIRYSPSINEPVDYYSVCITLINAIIEALNKNLNLTKTEIIILSKIKEEIGEIKRRFEVKNEQ